MQQKPLKEIIRWKHIILAGIDLYTAHTSICILELFAVTISLSDPLAQPFVYYFMLDRRL